MRGILPSLVLLGVLAFARPAPAAPAVPHEFHVLPDTLVANEAGEWRAELRIENHSEWGLYPDSLFMEWTSDDPDRSTAPHAGVRALDALVHIMSPAGQGEATGVFWNSPADFEHGRLRFRLVAHDAARHVLELFAPVWVAGSTLAEAHPAQTLEAAGQRTDCFVTRPDSSHLPAPGLLFVPPAGVPARSLLRWSLGMAERGYIVGVVSLPGAGRSTGEPDRAGPASVACVRAALERLAREPGVDPKRLVLWGQDDGATAVLLAAVDRKDVAGIVAQEADHDPWASYRALRDDASRAAFVAAAGRDSAGWKARSTLGVATRIAAPVLLIETLDSRVRTSEPARAFAARRTEDGLYIESRLNATEPRAFRRNDANRVALDFLSRRTRQVP